MAGTEAEATARTEDAIGQPAHGPRAWRSQKCPEEVGTSCIWGIRVPEGAWAACPDLCRATPRAGVACPDLCRATPRAGAACPDPSGRCVASWSRVPTHSGNAAGGEQPAPTHSGRAAGPGHGGRGDSGGAPRSVHVGPADVRCGERGGATCPKGFRATGGGRARCAQVGTAMAQGRTGVRLARKEGGREGRPARGRLRRRERVRAACPRALWGFGGGNGIRLAAPRAKEPKFGELPSPRPPPRGARCSGRSGLAVAPLRIRANRRLHKQSVRSLGDARAEGDDRRA